MKIFLSLIHVILSLALMAVVLLQHRKQGGFGGVFGGGTQADAGQWQRFTSLTKLTVVLAGFFMLTSLLLILI
ncbi:MAG: preprotein translocase subunit SecG [Synergistaceae bacterium]|jgi:preprotein translocase subunit SecG|nr:preprotein translocase subunit SecG [Synergistaceae bacterium]